MEIIGTEHWLNGTSAHDGAPIRLHLWEKRAGGDTGAFSRNGNIVLLMHGSRRSGHMAFDLSVPTEPGEFTYSLMDALAARGFDVFSLDVQCYGRSDRHPSGLRVTTEVAAADTAVAVDHICGLRGVDKLHLVGFSWSATTAAVYAERTPARIRKLVLYGGRVTRLEGVPPVTDDFSRNSDEEAAATLQPHLTEPKVLPIWQAESERWDPKPPNGVMADFQNRLPLSDPAKLTMPILMVYGSEDFQLRAMPAIAQYFAGIATPDRQLVLIPEAGHAVHLHRGRRRFADTLVGFFQT